MSTLPQLIVGKLPPGRVRCTACDCIFTRQSGGAEQPRHIKNFEITGCPYCGHIMRRNPPRDLTRAEAAELAASPDFPRVRAVVDAAVKHLVG